MSVVALEARANRPPNPAAPPQPPAPHCSAEGRWSVPTAAITYNVKAFGAKGDGRTDDTAALQVRTEGSGQRVAASAHLSPPWRSTVRHPHQRLHP